MSAKFEQRPTASVPGRFRHGTKAYDLLAVSPLIIWYVYALWATLPNLIDGFHGANTRYYEVRFALELLTRVSQFAFGLLLLALIIVRRPPLAGHRGLVPRLIAMLGSYLGIAMIVFPIQEDGSRWLALSSFLMLFGMLFAVYSLAWLGRSFSIMPESRKLVNSGPYSLIRHPLYLGEQIALVGVALQSSNPLVLALITLQFCCQIYRMNYEEQILAKTFPEYEDYITQTDRLLPWIY